LILTLPDLTHGVFLPVPIETLFETDMTVTDSITIRQSRLFFESRLGRRANLLRFVSDLATSVQ
jgi:hypothetical protein